VSRGGWPGRGPAYWRRTPWRCRLPRRLRRRRPRRARFVIVLGRCKQHQARMPRGSDINCGIVSGEQRQQHDGEYQTQGTGALGQSEGEMHCNPPFLSGQRLDDSIREARLRTPKTTRKAISPAADQGAGSEADALPASLCPATVDTAIGRDGCARKGREQPGVASGGRPSREPMPVARTRIRTTAGRAICSGSAKKLRNSLRASRVHA
jgi:hypothetical protein